MKKSLIKLQNWEYWPLWAIYFLVFFAWLYYSFRLKSFFFFSNINPNITLSGLAGSSKMSILNQIPKKFIPNSILIFANENIDIVQKKINNKAMGFPFVVKPDVGERGLSIKVCNNLKELKDYTKSTRFDFIIQEFINYPIELAVLYYRKPNETTGVISSLCEKEFLSVIGNGKDNIKTLMSKNNRALLQLHRFEKEHSSLLKIILKKDEKYIIEPIGNHSRGTIFLDKNKLIDKDLVLAFDKLSKQIPDMHFGRFDLKCTSIDDLKQLKNFSIIEINGVSAEPAHIYDPVYSFWKGQKVLLKQWQILFEISKIQISKGVKPISFKSAIGHLKAYKMQLSLH